MARSEYEKVKVFDPATLGQKNFVRAKENRRGPDIRRVAPIRVLETENRGRIFVGPGRVNRCIFKWRST